MENQSKNSLILVTCVRGSADQIMVTAREQGARGGTVIKARWSGMEELERGYDLELTAERELQRLQPAAPVMVAPVSDVGNVPLN